MSECSLNQRSGLPAGLTLVVLLILGSCGQDTAATQPAALELMNETPGAVPQEQDFDGWWTTMTLTLEGALSLKDEDKPWNLRIGLDLFGLQDIRPGHEVTGGRFNRGTWEISNLSAVNHGPEGITLSFTAKAGGDRRAAGGEAAFTCVIKRQGDRVVGSYEGTATWKRRKNVYSREPSGSLSGTLTPNPVPMPRKTLISGGHLGTEVFQDMHGKGFPERLRATIDVPTDIQPDTYLVPVLRWFDGRFFQAPPLGPLRPGRWAVNQPIDLSAGFRGENSGPATIFDIARSRYAGLAVVTSGSATRALGIPELAVDTIPTGSTTLAPWSITDLHLDPLQIQTGELWELQCLPEPFPTNPTDHRQFTFDLEVTRPDGVKEVIPGYFHQEMVITDRGDRETAHPTGVATFRCRYRPRVPGAHRLRLIGQWNESHMVSAALPTLSATGSLVDDYIRVHTEDTRFLSRAARGSAERHLWFPIGVNLHSTLDRRGVRGVGTTLTPDRRWASYRDRLLRYKAAGVDAVEIWMSSWNLGLEWREDWPGYHGLHGYNDQHAETVDRILSLADDLEMGVVLVIRNHMQGKRGSNFKHNPHNIKLGGELESPGELFTHPAAYVADTRRRRYLIGRYAHHPSILAWKMWSENNLTHSKKEDRVAWHRKETKLWKEQDPYGHLVTTHWNTSPRGVNRETASLQSMDIVVFNHYAKGRPPWTLGDIREGAVNPLYGMNALNKPGFATEYGGSWSGANNERLERDMRTGNWVAYLSGQAATPMNWWHEWVEQTQSYGPYRAFRQFIEGEDPTGGKAATFRATHSDRILWSLGWVRAGYLLGYCVDKTWAQGDVPKDLAAVTVLIGNNVGAGSMNIEWWDPDSGTIIRTDIHEHQGGPLNLTPPPFSCHIAWKMRRP